MRPTATGSRVRALVQIGIGGDKCIHTIDITGDPDRLGRVVLILPYRPSQECLSAIGYQGHQTTLAGIPTPGQGEDHAR